MDWQGLIDNYDRIREHIEHVVPGFTQYNKRVREPGGFYLPNPPNQGKFKTPSARARFTVHPIPEHQRWRREASADHDPEPRSVQYDYLQRKRPVSRYFPRPPSSVSECRRHDAAGN